MIDVVELFFSLFFIWFSFIDKKKFTWFFLRMEKNLPQLSFDGSVSLRETFAVSLNRRSASDGIARSTIIHYTSVNSSSAKTRRNPFNFTTHPFLSDFCFSFLVFFSILEKSSIFDCDLLKNFTGEIFASWLSSTLTFIFELKQ